MLRRWKGASDGVRLREGGSGALAYAEAVVTYLAFAVDKCADYGSNICTWNSSNEQMRSTFPAPGFGDDLGSCGSQPVFILN